MTLKVGTRRSALAQAQTRRVLRHIEHAERVVIEGEGDHDTITPLHQLDTPGAFTATLTQAIVERSIDAAVHSLKDLPLEAPGCAPIVAHLERDDPADLLLIHPDSHDPSTPLHVRPGSRVGSSAPRRQSQLKHADPTVAPIDIRGNIQRRIQLLEHRVIDALVIASAVFDRMSITLPSGTVRHRLDPDRFPGSPGQAVIAIQAHEETDPDELARLRQLDHAPTRRAAEGERTVLAALGGGCGLPLGVYIAQQGDTWHLSATLQRGAQCHQIQIQASDPETLADRAAAAFTSAPSGPALDPRGPNHADQANARTTDPKHIILTLDPARLEHYRTHLASHGHQIHGWPLIEIEPTHTPLPLAASGANWIAITSPRAAEYAAQAVAQIGRLPRVAAIGPATARAARAHGLPVHAMPRTANVDELGAAIQAFPRKDGADTLVLWPRATKPAGDLDIALGRVIHWPVYETHHVQPPPDPPRQTCDLLVLTSPSNARALTAHPNPIKAERTAAFGPRTAIAMRDAGRPPDITLQDRTPEAVGHALVSSDETTCGAIRASGGAHP